MDFKNSNDLADFHMTKEDVENFEKFWKQHGNNICPEEFPSSVPGSGRVEPRPFTQPLIQTSANHLNISLDGQLQAHSGTPGLVSPQHGFNSSSGVDSIPLGQSLHPNQAAVWTSNQHLAPQAPIPATSMQASIAIPVNSPIAGFDWNILQEHTHRECDDQGRPHLFKLGDLKFQNLNEAEAARVKDFHRWTFDHVRDTTFPWRQEQQQCYIVLLVRAMINTDGCVDNEVTIANFKRKLIKKPDMIQIAAWHILDSILEHQLKGGRHGHVIRGKAPSYEHKTFGHVMDVCQALRVSKSNVESISYRYWHKIHAFIDDPISHVKKSIANQVVNNRRGEILKTARYGTPDNDLSGAVTSLDPPTPPPSAGSKRTDEVANAEDDITEIPSHKRPATSTSMAAATAPAPAGTAAMRAKKARMPKRRHAISAQGGISPLPEAPSMAHPQSYLDDC